MNQVFNPYLPGCEYVPDGEPHVFGDRLYLFGSHDAFGGVRFCPNDYVLWSTPTTDLADWRCDGVIYRADQDPRNPDGRLCLYAPDVVMGPDGRYYLYYTLEDLGVMSVAVSDKPDGQYKYYGDVRMSDGRVIGEREGDPYQFDPGLLADDDGRIWLYSGFGIGEGSEPYFHGLKAYGMYVMQLAPDMLTVMGEPKLLLPSNIQKSKTCHGFFEASSIRKIEDLYYLIYSSGLSHELCYMTSKYPDRDFEYGGTLISIGDIGLNGRKAEHTLDHLGNTHGSIVEVNGQWYVFYHRQTNRSDYSRQGCAEKISIASDGSIAQAERTSCGLNPGPLTGSGIYPAHIACALFSEGHEKYHNGKEYSLDTRPFLTQDKLDRPLETSSSILLPEQYITNWRSGGVIGYKYFQLDAPVRIAVEAQGSGRGFVEVFSGLDEEDRLIGLIASIPILPTEDRCWHTGEVTANARGTQPLYFRYTGEGSLNFYRFSIEGDKNEQTAASR